MTAVDFRPSYGRPLEPSGPVARTGPVATVHDIASAPSLRKARLVEEQLQAARLRHPAYRARPAVAPRPNPVAVPKAHPVKVTPTGRSAAAFAPAAGRVGRYVLTLFTVVAVSFAVGWQLQAPSYAGATWDHSVAVGESVWGLADRVGSDRPLGEVVEDIRALNGLGSDLLVPGQVLTLPVE